MDTVVVPEILLPVDCSRLDTWAVTACDQFTSDEEYWKRVGDQISGCPSTGHLIFPEIYLKKDPDYRIAEINRAMHTYLSQGVFRTVNGMILVERTTQSGTRTGIVLAIDLENYSYEKGAKTLIRSTEATILERIPPRVAIRKNAPMELPHVMLLYDDDENAVLNCVKRGERLYEGDLMLGGGRVKGTMIANPEEVIAAFSGLVEGSRSLKRYGTEEGILFAVGDGNHSLATAKTCWENLKPSLTKEQRETHPARYALCEAVNLYDPALRFEPIHRYVKCKNGDEFLSGLKTSGGKSAYIVIDGKRREIPFPTDIPEGIRAIDGYIAEFLRKNGGEVDYVHGADELVAYTLKEGVGVILPPIDKDDFFRLIVSGGNLPRKTFSMGEGNEKRYYIEARKITVDSEK